MGIEEQEKTDEPRSGSSAEHLFLLYEIGMQERSCSIRMNANHRQRIVNVETKNNLTG